jgi:cytidine deaminase
VCAERVAFFTALHDGKSDFTAIAIAGGEQAKEGKLCPPCGVCLQVMSEFCKGDFTIILCDGEGSKILTLDELLPHRFALEK